MLKPAFSTVACPDWTLDRVALAAGRMGFLGVELRTFGVDSRAFACDPAMTAPEKVRRLFRDAGVQLAAVATDCSFDERVSPPVVGHLIKDTEVQVRAAQRAVDIAQSIEAPLVRVFGFRLTAAEKRASGVARVADRLRKVVDHAHRSGVTVMVEAGGSFSTAAEMAELLSAAALVMPSAHAPLLRVCGNVQAAAAAGEHPTVLLSQLADRVSAIRVKDAVKGRPVLLGDGQLPVRETVAAAARMNAWAIFEWDRAWLPDIGEPDFALDHASRTLWQWIGTATGAMRPGGARPAAVGAGY